MFSVTSMRGITALALLAIGASAAVAEPGEYQSRAAFLEEAFGSAQPPTGVVWMDRNLQEQAAEILGHPYDGLRVRYWYEGNRTAWIVDEIGKEKPITLGIVVEDGEIRMLRVLRFRESRGWEIRYPFFTRQFPGVALTDKGALDQRIDGITGATLSVGAAKRSARLALFLDAQQKRRQHARAP